MIEIHAQAESVPTVWPDVPAGLSDKAAALAPGVVWGSIEAHTAHRFSERQIAWTVEGEGEWVPPIGPVISFSAEQWVSPTWEAITLETGPVGVVLPFDSTFKITTQVGGGTVPDTVYEAYRRLAEYLAGDPGTPGASSSQERIGNLSVSFERSPAWLAKAMQNSGAADLLRNHRRL